MDPSILWGAAATALAGATLAEWERQREEERKRKEAEEAIQQRRENTEKRQGQKAQEDAVRERWAAEAETKTNGDKGLHSSVQVQVVKPTPIPAGLSPEAQAAFLHGGTSATSWIGSNASTLQTQHLADLTRQKEREKEKAAYDQRMDEHTGEQDVVDKWNLEHANQEGEISLFDKWTSPSSPSSSIYGKPGWVDLLPPLLKYPLGSFYENQSDKPVKNILPDNKFFNLVNNIGSFNSGFTTQLINDLTLGGYGWFTGWQPENSSQRYQEGMGLGRVISNVYGQIEIAFGGALVLSSISLIPPTIGGTAACAAATGPGAVFCIGVGTSALVVEGATALGGFLLGGHGAGVLWNNGKNPLQIRAEGSGGTPKIGDQLPGKPGVEYTYRRTQKQIFLDYELHATGRPYKDLEVLIKNVDTPRGEVSFDWYEGDTLIDAKYANANGDGYKFDLNAPWQQGIKEGVLDEAERQLKALESTDQFRSVEWRVSDKDSAQQLQKFLNANGFGEIEVKWVP